ncbi:MAG: radical SAM protein [Candidatus Jordarchaeales archaeon]
MVPLEAVVWPCTLRCNGACVHCYVRGRFHAELGTEDGRRLVAEAAEAGAGMVSFVGGEPLMREDLPELMRYAVDLGMGVEIVTNGFLVDGRVAELLSRLEVRVLLSVDGASKKVCESVRGGGAWEKILSAAGVMKASGLEFTPVMAISALNFHEAGKFVSFSCDLGGRMASFLTLMPSGAAKGNRSLALTPEKLKQALIEIGVAADSLSYPAEVRCTPFAEMVVRSKHVKVWGCYYRVMDLNTVGDVLLCDVLDFKVGNILRDGGPESWRKLYCVREGTGLLDWRMLEGKCSSCPIRETCLGGCRARAYIETGSFFKPDPLCPF